MNLKLRKPKNLSYQWIMHCLFSALIICTIFKSDIVSAQSFQPEKTRLDPAMLISVAKVRQKLKAAHPPVLVDVRHKSAYEKFKIPGSINLPVHALKTKTFLKNREVVLIHEGYWYSKYMDEIKKLNRSGFNIRLLSGGLKEWHTKKAPLTGDIFAREDLMFIPPFAFFTEQNLDIWIFVDISHRRLKVSRDVNAFHIPFEKIPGLKPSLPEAEKEQQIKATPFYQEIKKLLRKKNSPVASFIMFNQDGKNYDEVQRYIKITGQERVFYLKGGFSAYEKFLHNMQLAQKTDKRKTRSVDGCEVCE